MRDIACCVLKRRSITASVSVLRALSRCSSAARVGGKNKDAARRRQPRAHLTRALPVDLEQQAAARRAARLRPRAGSVPYEIVEHLRVLQEFAARRPWLEIARA